MYCGAAAVLPGKGHPCFCQRTTYSLRAQVEVTKTWGEENKRWKLFITRFYKCHFCFSGHTAPEELKACHTSFQEHYEFAFCRFHRYLHWSYWGDAGCKLQKVPR